MESNVQKMREALEALNCIDTRGLKRLLMELVEADIFDGGLINKTISIVEKARAALYEPMRNCDIGTVKEQFKMWQSFCEKFDNDCTGCPCDGHSPSLCYCILEWAQMPYEAAKEGERK